MGRHRSRIGRARVGMTRGKWADNAYDKAGTNPTDVSDRLVNAAENGQHTSLRVNAKTMIEEMSERNWQIAAGPHQTTATAGQVLDRTPHITIELDGKPFAYHLRLDSKGHIWEVRTMDRVGGKTTTVNPAPGTDRPWKGPGQ